MLSACLSVLWILNATDHEAIIWYATAWKSILTLVNSLELDRAVYVLFSSLTPCLKGYRMLVYIIFDCKVSNSY